MCVPDDDDLHIWRAEDLETKAGGENLDDEEPVRDFRERPRRGVDLRNATEGDALIGTVVPAQGELDVESSSTSPRALG
jgi:hypothetical protein